ncbi:MAG: FecR family protein [Muribaculaceae bacterium]
MDRKNLLSSNLSKQIVKDTEPNLSLNEKKEMWGEINHRTQWSVTAHKRKLWVGIAASIILLICGTITINFLNNRNNLNNLFSLIDVTNIKDIKLIVGDQQFNIAKDSEIKCNLTSNKIEVNNNGVELFSLCIPDAETKIQMAVPAGKSSKIILSDNSEINLKAQSQLITPFAFCGSKREIYLRGEAFLKVSRNEKKQFITHTKSLKVGVLGTEFIVSAYPLDKEETVTLVSGRVEVATIKGDVQVMNPNDHFSYNKSNGNHSMTHNIDSEPLAGWTQKVLVAKNESLEDVFNDLEKYYDIRLNYDKASMTGIRINGKIDISVPIETVLNRLSKIAPITIKREKNKEIFITITKPLN